KSLKKLSDEIFSFTAEEYKEDVKRLMPAVSAFFGMLREYEKEYKRLKAEKNIIDFSDVEHIAIELLTEKDGEKRVKSQLAKDLSEDFEEIMVDEFQDTNECQYAIFKAVSRNEENLFTVGDIKQSIYRFRLADPGIFLRKLNSYSPIEKGSFPAKIILKDNFRSARSVCSLINCIFERIMTEHTGEIDYGEEQRLEAFSEDECTPEVAVIEKEDEESEAVFVAERIKELLKSGYEVGGEKKFPSYGDIAVIMRTRRSFSAFSKVFTRYSIPYSVQSAESLFDTRECSTLLSFLKIIDNPMLDIDFAAVMLSPVFGFTPDDLIKLKLKRKKKLYECAKESEDVRIVKFLELLKNYKSISLSMSTSELIKKIIYETDFVNIFSALESGEERRGNLLRFLNAAKQFEKSGTVMLSSFIRYCDKCILNSGGFGGGNLVTGGRSVRLMTVHASKGLEFPVCFVSDTGRKFRRDNGRNPIIMHNSLGLCLKIRDLNRYISYTTAPYEAAKALGNREFLAEEMRILYVALTRAREKLIISAAVANREKYLDIMRGKKLQDEFEIMRADSYIDWILPVLYQKRDAVLSVWKNNED
ncbi:MAG: 3'-5' exonuclease, partial [Acutalibacteraceae bacterium]